MLSQNRALKRNGSLHSKSSFARQEEKRAGSYATFLKTPKLGGSVKGVNRDREGWMEYRKGDPRKRLAPSDPLNGFPLSGYGESGWEGSGVLPTPFGADAVTLSPHASTHLFQLCKEANKQTTSDTRVPKLKKKKKKIRCFFGGKTAKAGLIKPAEQCR